MKFSIAWFYNFFTNSSQILQVLTQPFHVPTQRVNPVPTQKKVAQTKPSKQSLCLDQNPNQMTLLPFVLPTLLLKPLPKCRATQQIVCQSEKHLTQVEFRPELSGHGAKKPIHLLVSDELEQVNPFGAEQLSDVDLPGLVLVRVVGWESDVWAIEGEVLCWEKVRLTCENVVVGFEDEFG